MPLTAVLREPLAGVTRWGGETETSFRESVRRRRKETPMSATLAAAQLGRACLPQPDLVSRGRQGRPLRCLGAAGTVLWGALGGVPVPALAGAGDGRRSPPAAGGTHPFTDAIVEADSYW